MGEVMKPAGMAVNDVRLDHHNGGIDAVGLYAVIVLFTVVASILSIVLLSLSYFDVPLLIGGTIVASLGCLRIFPVSLRPIRPVFPYIVVCLVVVASLLRSDLYPHLMGGQDQGLYVNMAEQILRDKSLAFQDHFRQEMSPEARETYDQSPMGSVHLRDPIQSTETIVFYPLHPVWMAISKWVFGDGFHTLSLFYFAALGIIGGCFLTQSIFSNRVSTLIAGLFLSINPALVFFSKYPTTEIVAFAFSVNGFLFLLNAVRAQTPASRWLYWLIALLCFNGFFYTRMQFFAYLPFFGILSAGLLLDKEIPIKNKITLLSFIGALCLTFSLSIIFYFFFQRELFDGIIVEYIPSLINRGFIVFFVTSVTLFSIVLFMARSSYTICRKVTASGYRLFGKMKGLAPWMLPLLFLASIPSIISFYGNGEMRPFRFLVPVGEDVWLIRYHAIYRFALMLSPLGLFLLFLAPYIRTTWTTSTHLGFLFLGTIWMGMLMQPWVPYLYYYGRYLSGEMIPYSLILISGIIGVLLRSHKYLARTIVVFMAIYFSYFSFSQYNKFESDSPEFYREASKYISPRDVVLAFGMDERMYVPLRVIYGFSIFPLTGPNIEPLKLDHDVINQLSRLAEKRGGNLILLTHAPASGIERLGHLTFRDQFLSNGEHIRGSHGIYDKNDFSRLFLPVKQYVNVRSFDLYKLDQQSIKRLFNDECTSDLILGSEGALYIWGLSGFSSPEQHGVWSNGTSANYECKLVSMNSIPHQVTIEFTAFVPAGHKQEVIVSVNEGNMVRVVVDSDTPSRKLVVPLPQLVRGDEISIEFQLPKAISPASIGLSSDSRRLGISVSRISLE